MDGRKWVAAALILTMPACGALDSIEAAGDALDKRAEQEAPGLERPTLEEIFRDGRYEFQDAPKAERIFDKLFAKDPEAAQGIEDVVAMHVFPRRVAATEIVSIAFLLADPAIEDPAFWDGFLRGAAESSGEDVEEGTLEGAMVAYADSGVEVSLTIYYARDLIVTIAGPPDTPRSELDDIARYLLDAR